MRVVIAFVAVVVAGMAAGCATAPPAELVQARTAYARASVGPAAQLAPADLRKARLALDQAERALSDEKNLAKAVDFAYIAERTAQIAEAHAETALTEKEAWPRRTSATRSWPEPTGAAPSWLKPSAERRSRRNRSASSARLVRPPSRKADASEQKAGASEEKAAASEQRAQQANDALDRLSAKADGRGMVITLSGSVLFRSNGAELLPAALRRLDEVASVLVAQGQSVVVEGYTDSKGSPWSNVDLSRRRAEAVRSVSRLPRMPDGPDRGARHGTGSPDRGQRERRGARQQSPRRDRDQSA